MEKEMKNTSVFMEEEPVILENQKEGTWKHTIVEADNRDIGADGVIELSFAKAKEYNKESNKYATAEYKISKGIWTGQEDNATAGSVGIDWENVKEVIGQTYNVKDFLKEKGFVWNSKSKSWVKKGEKSSTLLKRKENKISKSGIRRRLSRMKNIMKEKMTNKTIVLDTETTGFNENKDDEILELGICNLDGEKIYQKYFKPINKTEWQEAESVHGISKEMVEDEPTILEEKAIIMEILNEVDTIVGYNTEFDIGFLEQCLDVDLSDKNYVDVMRDFADIYGEWNEEYNCYKWKNLSFASEFTNYDWGYDTAHGALADAKATAHVYAFNEINKDKNIEKNCDYNIEIKGSDKNNISILVNVKGNPLTKEDYNFLKNNVFQTYFNDTTNETSVVDTQLPSGRWFENISVNNEHTRMEGTVDDISKNKEHIYYSTQRPISLGTYPIKNLVGFENYDERTYIDEIGKKAWGKLIYSEPLDENTINEYEFTSNKEINNELIGNKKLKEKDCDLEI